MNELKRRQKQRVGIQAYTLYVHVVLIKTIMWALDISTLFHQKMDYRTVLYCQDSSTRPYFYLVIELELDLQLTLMWGVFYMRVTF